MSTRMNNLLVYCMMMANPAPSSSPRPLLHFILDPRMHRFVALRIVKGATCFMNILASRPICPSTDSTKGETDACHAVAASLYFLFFSHLAADGAASTELWTLAWASVSMTHISNNASALGCYTPLTHRSATKAGRFLISAGSLSSGSLITSL